MTIHARETSTHIANRVSPAPLMPEEKIMAPEPAPTNTAPAPAAPNPNPAPAPVPQTQPSSADDADAMDNESFDTEGLGA